MSMQSNSHLVQTYCYNLKSKNRNAKNIAKYNAKYSRISAKLIRPMVHAWIVCTSWNKLGYYLKFFSRANPQF